MCVVELYHAVISGESEKKELIESATNIVKINDNVNINNLKFIQFHFTKQGRIKVNMYNVGLCTSNKSL
jgi:hypothetical protein